MDARKEGAPVIAIAGDVETSMMDTGALEELNPYKFFETASLYTGRVVHLKQARAGRSTRRFSSQAVVELGPSAFRCRGQSMW